VEYRTLGRTGVKVSSHCLGTMMFGGWGNPDPDDCVRIIHRALDAGVNFIDTADVYSRGESEEIVGRALHDRRDDVVLATKVYGEMGKGLNERGTSRLWIMREVEASLRRLGTDRIDLYQLHRPDLDTDLEDTLEALTDLVAQGKVRYAGTSCYPAWLLAQAHEIAGRRGLVRLACEQPPYSIFTRHIELDVLEVTRRYGMGVIVWSPLAGGWLTGKYRRGEEAPMDSRMTRAQVRGSRVAQRFDLSRPGAQRKLDLVEELLPIADKAGIPLAHMAIAFTLAHPSVTSAIIGPRTMDQLEDLLAGADVRLDEAILDAIDEVVPPGTVVDDADRGWDPPWLEPENRRRS
jgi:aryl-alcohol dehydrogenase-like predicted oxidoreductase